MNIQSTSDYAHSIAAYRPPTFVADTAKSVGSPSLTALSPSELANLTSSESASQSAAMNEVPGFGDMVKGFFKDINDRVETANDKTQAFMTGKSKDQGAVVTSVEEANLSLQFGLAVRNKIITAYQSIEAMQY